MSVEDIYGEGGIGSLGLPRNLLASSMGKVSKVGNKSDIS